MRKTLHVGLRSEVEPAKENQSPVRFLCGRVFVPEKDDHLERPICKTCDKARRIAEEAARPKWFTWRADRIKNWSIGSDPIAA